MDVVVVGMPICNPIRTLDKYISVRCRGNSHLITSFRYLSCAVQNPVPDEPILFSLSYTAAEPNFFRCGSSFLRSILNGSAIQEGG